jgi:hypothetical protein
MYLIPFIIGLCSAGFIISVFKIITYATNNFENLVSKNVTLVLNVNNEEYFIMFEQTSNVTLNELAIDFCSKNGKNINVYIFKIKSYPN